MAQDTAKGHAFWTFTPSAAGSDPGDLHSQWDHQANGNGDEELLLGEPEYQLQPVEHAATSPPLPQNTNPIPTAITSPMGADGDKGNLMSPSSGCPFACAASGLNEQAFCHRIGMPYAFAQFTNNEDARTAMEQGRGIMILGRPCRTEMVRANRTYIIYSRGDRDITIDEARRIFESYGSLSRCEPQG
ncbi:hypothetical protein VTJ49DRAFT_732 [Mycothermus thermophilus]|uniref:Uncharacterized protein n=1 Tax=Humicola insolens TaxID=85995 RepID=A0ABR3VE68_HUMIN